MQVKSSRSAKFFFTTRLGCCSCVPACGRCQRRACLLVLSARVRKLGVTRLSRVTRCAPCGSSILPPAKGGVLRRREGGALNRRTQPGSWNDGRAILPTVLLSFSTG